MRKRKSAKTGMYECYDLFGSFVGWAWRRSSPYTSYLFYAEPKGYA
jgi:hypothetical protein